MSKVKNLGKILFGIGMAGVVISEALAIHDTIKAKRIVDNASCWKSEDGEECERVWFNKEETILQKFEDAKDIVALSWTSYIPTAIATTMTLGCLAYSKKLDAKKIASLTTLMGSSVALVNQYRNKIKEYASPEILAQIDREVAQERKGDTYKISENGGKGETVICKDDEIRVYDPITKRMFKTSKLALISAKMLINQQFAYGSEVPFSMFFNLQGEEIPEEYESYGWCWEDFNDGYIWIDISHEKKHDEEGEYYELSYDVDPREVDITNFG